METAFRVLSPAFCQTSIWRQDRCRSNVDHQRGKVVLQGSTSIGEKGSTSTGENGSTSAGVDGAGGAGGCLGARERERPQVTSPSPCTRGHSLTMHISDCKEPEKHARGGPYMKREVN